MGYFLHAIFCSILFREKVVVPVTKPYISFIGKQSKTEKTVITWSDKAGDKAKDGSELGTLRTASVTIESDYFCATGITIQVPTSEK